MIIAVDGPAGSGKGTISKLLAKKLNYTYVDTGSMYRSLTYLVLHTDVDIYNEEEVAKAFKECDLKLTSDAKCILNGEDITDKIRTQEINDNVSILSKYPTVRDQMKEKQRLLAKDNNIVMEGRDITTEVFPDADYKFYLDASIEERTRRRMKQNEENGLESDYNEIYESIKNRDYNDMNREYGALRRTPEQIYIDSSDLTIDEVVNSMMEVIK